MKKRSIQAKSARYLEVVAALLLTALLLGCAADVPSVTAGGTADSETASATTTAISTITPPVTTQQPNDPQPPSVDPAIHIADILEAVGDMESDPAFGEDFLRTVQAQFGDAALEGLADSLNERAYSRELWYAVTGNSFFVLRDLATGAAQGTDNLRLLSLGQPGTVNSITKLTFGGDICLADNYLPMQYMHKNGLDITDCIDPALIEVMQTDDLTFFNNEFTISDRGTPMAGKYYTFRAAVKNTALYNTLGVDIVGLANNHAYDYGKDAFLDTLTALADHGVDAVGGGRNIQEAMRPMYYLVNGRKIAYVAASRAEKHRMTPEATATEPGILRCYDTAKFLSAIREAEANSDFVIACVHWGTEYSAELEEVQITSGKAYIDAGADLIVGAHAHQLQGIDYYKGKPIFYNLGNFWFNDYTLGTGLLQVELHADGSVDCRFLPALQEGCVTSSVAGKQMGKNILYWLAEHSPGVWVEADGRVYEKKE